jgi:hypothetical protein
MATRFDDVVKGYAGLGTWLVEQWSARASAVAAKLDAGAYDANDAAADLDAAAVLAIRSAFMVASEPLDAIAILLVDDERLTSLDSQSFHAPPGARLALNGALADLLGHTLSASVAPSQLDAGRTGFVLRVDPTGQPGATYFGQVDAFTSAPDPVPVPVWITIA